VCGLCGVRGAHVGTSGVDGPALQVQVKESVAISAAENAGFNGSRIVNILSKYTQIPVVTRTGQSVQNNYNLTTVLNISKLKN